MKQFFKLTMPKGSRKKRAHKKWMKKSGAWSQLKNAEAVIMKDWNDMDMDEKFSKACCDLMTYGHSSIQIGSRGMIKGVL
jgi:hypothetical protein